MDLDLYLKETNFDKQFLKLKKRIQGKRVIMYGTGSLFQHIYSKYDLSCFNIIAVSDGKYAPEEKGKEFMGYKILTLKDISEEKPDYILVSILNYTDIIFNLESVFFPKSKIKIIPLVQKKFLTELKEIWSNS